MKHGRDSQVAARCCGIWVRWKADAWGQKWCQGATAI